MRFRRLTAGLAWVLCFVPASASPAAAAPRTGQVRAARAPLAVSITQITPKAVRPNGPDSRITISGTLANQSAQPIAGLQVRMRFGGRAMVHRGELAQAAQQPVTALNPVPSTTRPLGNLAAGARGLSWQLRASAAELGFNPDFGVYAVGVEFLNAAGQSLGGQVTFLTYMPRGSDVRRVSVGWVWPLADRMHRTDEETFVDDRLAGELEKDGSGRLTALVDAAAQTPTPVTWAIDPALLADVQRMTGRYVLREPKKKERLVAASQDARDWLAALRSASGSDAYFALPYADVDADALVRGGMGKDLDYAFAVAGAAGQILGRPTGLKIAWPTGGVAQSRTLSRLARTADTFLMTGAAFTPADDTYTPSSPASVRTSAGVRSVVTYDATISGLVSGNIRTPGAATLARQRFLAETAMIAAELPGLARTIVIAPDRRWNPDPGFARSLLADTAQTPWLKGAEISKIAQTRPAQQQAYGGYRDVHRTYEISQTHLADVRNVRTRANRFGSILDPVSYPFARGILRAESASWRGGGQRRAGFLSELSSKVLGRIAEVRPLLGGNSAQLAGRTGRIPLTIKNGLSERVHVRLRVTSRLPQRLQIGGFEADLKLNRGEAKTAQIEVKSYAQGPAEIVVQLLTPDGREYAPEQTITVNTTGYGPMALLITGGALAVLFVGVGIRAVRARRRDKMEAAGDGSPGSSGGGRNTPATPLGR